MNVALIGDFSKGYAPQMSVADGLLASTKKMDEKFNFTWVSTEAIDKSFGESIKNFDGFNIMPGSPYKNLKGVLEVIKYARENKMPLLGCCAGFQHMLLEYALNVLKIENAIHAEYSNSSENVVISALTCNLKGKELEVNILGRDSKTFKIYRSNKVIEKYYCSYGLNHNFQNHFERSEFKIVGKDDTNEARIIELITHPFFIGTLFVPQAVSDSKTDKLLDAFLMSVKEFSNN